MSWRAVARKTFLVVVALAAVLVPLLSLAIPDQVRIPRAHDHRKGAPAARALFSHAGHGELRCYRCHPSIFPQALVPFTHADMDRGRFCGACHDGRRAASVVSQKCEVCHAVR